MKGLVTRNTHVQYESPISSGLKVMAKVIVSKVSQTSRSRSQGQKLWYQVKGLVTRNTHVQYESPITSGLKVMAKVKVSKVGQPSRSRSQGQKLWYHVKGLVTRNTHVQYESPITSGLKVMTKVKVFVHATDADADSRAMTLAPKTYICPGLLKIKQD